ncbi:hypothetical protein [Fundidesulfovibrio terrae]|uniref:hypothetical protein n=1 Tax=Fundidesulfovibrio terrae TaxID=2922866 RepID=UPI001FAF6977|nr:hypothetical protein [Fundidesulfovibrio terrae]
MNKRRLVFAAIGIFLAGLLTGGVSMAFYGKMRLAPLVRMDKLGAAGFFLERMDFALKLSDKQKQEIRPIIEDTLARIRESRIPCISGEDVALKAGAERIRPLLEPEQQDKFTAFLEKAKERRKKFYGQ